MPISRGYPIRFTPRGLSDAADSTDVFPGACQLLQNLVFDPANPELVTSRPGVGPAIYTFIADNGFPGAGFISIHAAIGGNIYGMIRSTAFTTPRDIPFF